ncbi:MAG: AbrB/MazE/SpoVT family DNA-binding domain-containing protein [Oceanipulchritudo sp.]
MIIKMTSKRQVTFPKRVAEKFHLKAGDKLSVEETENGILVRPYRLDISKLAPLRHKIAQDLPEPDYTTVRHAALDPRLRS